MELANGVAEILSAAARGGDGARARARAVELAHELRSGECRRAMEACASLCARARAVEARHFGFGVLRDVARARWRMMSGEERMEMAKLAHGLLLDVAGADAVGEPYAVKSKAATLVAEVVRQEGASLWARLVPDLVAMAASEEPQRAEMGACVIRFVAEDVAVYNEDIIGGRMRELLGGLTSTVGVILPAIYSLMERHYTKATSTSDPQVTKQHAAAVSAAIGAAAVYGEWAPLAPIMRSGLIEACGMLLVRRFARFSCFLSFRERVVESPVTIILKDQPTEHPYVDLLLVLSEAKTMTRIFFLSVSRGGQLTDDPPIALQASDEFRVPACDALMSVVSRKTNVAQGVDEKDEKDIIKGLTLAANAMSTAAERIVSHPNQSDLISDQEEMVFVKRLAEAMTMMSGYHLSTITDENARNLFLNRFMNLTRFPSLEVLDVVIGAWPVMLRAMGAELPKTFVRGPPSQGADNPYSSQKLEPNGILPMGAPEVLLEIARVWFNAGAGIASGYESRLIPGNKAEEWLEECESALELRETWVQLRAKWMDVVKLCTALCPSNATKQAAENTLMVISWTTPGGVLANASDETKCGALEGATSFLEAVMLALPTDGPSFSMFSGTLESLLGSLVAVDYKAPMSNAQVAKLLEAFGKFGKARPELASTIMSRLFTILNELPADVQVGAPPVRQRDIIASGRTGQAARQKVCAAILIVCSAAPMALNSHLEAFAAQIESMKSTGRLSGAERGSLAEALLAVAGPSGPARVREVLEWLISSVRSRWVPGGTPSHEVAHLLAIPTMTAGDSAGGTQGLSSAHWELFHDIQLTERCLRRSLGDLESSNQPAGLLKPVDPPPDLKDCPAADHIDWVVPLVSTLLCTIHALWTPQGQAAMQAAGLGGALNMSPEERAAYLIHGPARTQVLSEEETGATASAARDWMRCLRDCSYSTFSLLSVHAPGAFYPSQALAAACNSSMLAHLPHMELRHIRQCMHAAVRPIMGRCPMAHRALWQAALVNPLCASLHDRLAAAWMDTRVVNATKTMDKREDDDDSLDGTEVEDLISERILREVTRDHCALLANVASPEGTYGRKTKGGGLTGVIGDMSNSVLGAYHAGGKHILDWIASGDPVAVRAGISTGIAALNWDDAEATGHAVNFIRALTAAAGGNDAPHALRETVGSDVFQACLVGLTQSSNAAHQSNILGLIRDIILWLLPKTQAVGQILMSLPGMTRESLDSCVTELAAMRSEKKAANFVKDFLINASGGGEELRALVEARSSSKTATAIQIPKIEKRNPQNQSQSSPESLGFTAEAASSAIGLH